MAGATVASRRIRRIGSWPPRSKEALPWPQPGRDQVAGRRRRRKARPPVHREGVQGSHVVEVDVRVEPVGRLAAESVRLTSIDKSGSPGREFDQANRLAKAAF